MTIFKFRIPVLLLQGEEYAYWIYMRAKKINGCQTLERFCGDVTT